MITLDPDAIVVGDDVAYKRVFVIFNGPAPYRNRFKVDTTKISGIVIQVYRRTSDNRKFIQFRLYDTSPLPSQIAQFNEWHAPASNMEKL